MADVPILHLPAFVAAFGRSLRACGVPVTPERSARFARALALAPPRTRDELYWTARTVLVSGREQLAAFERVFATVFAGFHDPAAFRGDTPAPPLRDPEPVRLGQRRPAGSMPSPPGPMPRGADARAAAEGDAARAREPVSELALAAASSHELLAERDFATLEADELRALRTLMGQLALAPPPRRARRRRRHPHGTRLDLRATLRAAARTGGDPARPVMRRRLEHPRRLVAICDVSGSMEPYARAYLQLLHAAVGGAGAEAFVFATRLTRLTRALAGGDPDVALSRAAAAVSDWSSGTRLGEALERFNAEHGRRGLARGAVVLIISDGWERGDPASVDREMARLRRLAHRIVWVNPRKAAAAFKPLAGGMAAALPYCDAFVSGHSARALAEVVDAVRGGGTR